MTRPFVSVALLLAFVPRPSGADDAADPGSWPLFQNQDTLHVRIEAPFTTLMRERSDTEYLPGTLAYTDASGAERVLDLELRARGHYRKQEDVCDLPPIRLNFKKEQVAGTEFAGQDKLKLVAHCQDKRDQYEQYVLKEYLAYRIFNVLTDLSFRARLLRVSYVDSDDERETNTHYAFLLEDDDLLAERIGAKVLEVPYTSYSELDPAQAALVSVFEYLIGNTDYSLIRGAKDEECCHNIVLFSKESGGQLAIPYDFDFSGLVNARYAGPNPKLRITRVTQRLYRGSCEHNGELDAALASLREHEPAIMETVASMEGLDDNSRERALDFLSEGYDDIADADSVEDNIISECLSSD